MIGGTQHLLCFGQFSIVDTKYVNVALMLGRSQNHIEIITATLIVVLKRKFLLGRNNHTIQMNHPFSPLRVNLTPTLSYNRPQRLKIFVKTGISLYGQIIYNLACLIENKLLLQVNNRHILEQAMIARHQLDLLGLFPSHFIHPPHPHPHTEENNSHYRQYDTIFMLFPESGRHHVENRIRRT